MAPIRVVVADDHAITREGCISCLPRVGDFEVVAAIGTSRELKPTIQKHQPDVLLLDLELDDGSDPVATVRELQETYPDLKIVIYTMHNEERWVNRMIEAEVPGYVLKSEPMHIVAHTIQEVLAGEKWYSPRVFVNVLPHLQADALTPREKAVLQGRADGKTYAAIALELGVSKRTVQNHVGKAADKLGAQTSTAAVICAFRRGLIE